MNRYEKEEIRNLPPKYRPLGAWAYFGYGFLFTIPFVGLICALVCALSSENIARRSYARSYFIADFFAEILIIAVVLVLWATGILDVIIAEILNLSSENA
ncbi:MAG: ABC transporter permease [Candidatus Gallimonas sp.]